MDAVLGNNPSYTWSSILAARDIIHEGAQWRVGDGQSIEVSTHMWLSHKPIFLGEQRQNLMVKNLLDANTLQWDRDKIFNLFAQRKRMEILSIALQSNLNWDVLI